MTRILSLYGPLLLSILWAITDVNSLIDCLRCYVVVQLWTMMVQHFPTKPTKGKQSLTPYSYAKCQLIVEVPDLYIILGSAQSPSPNVWLFQHWQRHQRREKQGQIQFQARVNIHKLDLDLLLMGLDLLLLIKLRDLLLLRLVQLIRKFEDLQMLDQRKKNRQLQRSFYSTQLWRSLIF